MCSVVQSMRIGVGCTHSGVFSHWKCVHYWLMIMEKRGDQTEHGNEHLLKACCVENTLLATENWFIYVFIRN